MSLRAFARRCLAFAVLCGALPLLPLPAHAQLVNPGFESGTAPWIGWGSHASHQAVGGNPGAYARLCCTQTLLCVAQNYTLQSCPGAENCRLRFDTRINGGPFPDGRTCTLSVRFNGIELYREDFQGPHFWTTVEVPIPCASGALDLCFVEPLYGLGFGNFLAGVDNVQVVCDGAVPVRSLTWGSVKSLYR